LPYLFQAGELNVNGQSESSANYATLDKMESYRRSDGYFHFKLTWPGDSTEYEWIQSSNPLTENVAGYQGINIPYTGRYWGGLEPSTSALMDGSVGHSNWFYAVGSFVIWHDGIPAYAKTEDDYEYPKQSVELYVFPPPTPAPSGTLIFRQTLPYLFQAGELNVNGQSESSANYATLDKMESYRRSDGYFHFKLTWPGDSTEYEWIQRSNPLTENIAGYQGINIPYTGRYWGGLEPSTSALMDGSVGHSNWFYAVGSFEIWEGGIPAYAKTLADYKYPKQSVELYVFW